MRLTPATVKAALKWNYEVYRRLKRIQGGMWAVAVEDDGEVIGMAIVGHAARMLGPRVLCVLRVAVLEGHRNACSMLYGACSRMARAAGCDGLVTYTHLDERGASLKASGWICDGETDGGEHSREGRQRALAIDPNPKRRWWAPWSEIVKNKTT